MFIFVFSWQVVDRLAFPAIMLFVRCFRPCDVCSALIYLDVCSDLVRGDPCNILLPITRSEIFGSFSSLDCVTDRRNSIVAATA